GCAPCGTALLKLVLLVHFVSPQSLEGVSGEVCVFSAGSTSVRRRSPICQVVADLLSSPATTISMASPGDTSVPFVGETICTEGLVVSGPILKFHVPTSIWAPAES